MCKRDSDTAVIWSEMGNVERFVEGNWFDFKAAKEKING